MTLGDQQRIFTLNVAKLIAWAYEQGYELTFAQTYRPPELAELYAEQGRGIARSLHEDRLAVDLNLFLDGAYLTASEDHGPLGQYWKSLDALNRWGGDFSNPDGNHYSSTRGGRS